MATINLGKVKVTPEGQYDPSKSYAELSLVGHEGSSYISIQDVPAGVSPTNTAYWQLHGSKGADGTNGADGNDGIDAYQPFKGWYDDSTTLSTAFPSPQVGDYAFVAGSTASDPVTVYKCTTAGTWAASSSVFNPANNQSFQTGQDLDQTKIINDPTTGGANHVLSAEAGKTINAKVDALGPKCDQNTTNIANLQQEIDAITPITIEGDVTNAPDEEDITTDANDLLKLKDRPTAVNQKGYKILRKGVSLASQMTDTNTIYEVRYAFDLNGGTLTIPSGCTLKFDGGKFSNGTIVGNGTSVSAPNYEIFKRGTTKYHGYTLEGQYSYAQSNQDGIILSGTWMCGEVGDNWCGLKNGSTTECSIALKNHILLCSSSKIVEIPNGIYDIYAPISVTATSVDFNGSTLRMSLFSAIEDTNIDIPNGAVSSSLRATFAMLYFGTTSNGSIKNLSINGRYSENLEPYDKLGFACGLDILSNSNKAKDVTVENVSIEDMVDCAVFSYGDDVKFVNCSFTDTNEHCIYAHNPGIHTFIGCKFVNYSKGSTTSFLGYERAALAVKFDKSDGYEYTDFAESKAIFNDCVFDVDYTYSQRPSCTFGGFVTEVYLNGCTFASNCRGASYGMLGDTHITAILHKLVNLHYTNCVRVPLNVATLNTHVWLDGCSGIFYSKDLYNAVNCIFEDVMYSSPMQNEYYGEFADGHSRFPILIDSCKFVGTTQHQCRIKTSSPITMTFRGCSFAYTSDFSSYTIATFQFLDGSNAVTSANVTFDSCDIKNYRNRICYINGGSITFKNCNIIASAVHTGIFLGSGNTVNMYDCRVYGLELGTDNVKTWSLDKVVDTSDKPIYYNKKRVFLADESAVTFEIKRKPLSDYDVARHVNVVPVNSVTPFTFVVSGDATHIIVTMHNNSESAIEYDVSYDFTEYDGASTVLTITSANGAPFMSDKFSYDGTKNHQIRCISNPDYSQTLKKLLTQFLDAEDVQQSGMYTPLNGEEKAHDGSSSSTVTSIRFNFNSYHTAGDYVFEVRELN